MGMEDILYQAELVNSGANPEDSQDMVSLDNVVYGK